MKKISLAPKNTYTLKEKISPSNATNKTVTWKSDKTSVATISSKDVVKAKKAGTIKIITTVDGKKATCTVKVKVPVNKVVLNKTKLTMGIKETFSLKTTVKPSNATNKTVKWKSSNKKFATVKNGKLSARKRGSATITVTVDSKKVTCKVTVKMVPTKKTKATLNTKSVKLKLKKRKPSRLSQRFLLNLVVQLFNTLLTKKVGKW